MRTFETERAFVDGELGTILKFRQMGRYYYTTIPDDVERPVLVDYLKTFISLLEREEQDA